MKPELVAQFQSALAGRYTIERELGRGGMATVFLAHDRDGTEVALKLLNPDLGSSIGADRFLSDGLQLRVLDVRGSSD